MSASLRFLTKLLFCVASLCLAAPPAAFAQNAGQPAQQEEAEDVLRISTNLVQTDVTVVDRSGRFVDNLGREQFELKVDGREQPVLFFERAAAGGTAEAARIRAARGETAEAAKSPAAPPVERGRSVLFFVDDMHLSPEGLARARTLLSRFIDEEVTPSMQVLIASASGQIGFLQQFTNDKAVLRAAVKRLSYQSRSVLDADKPLMSANQALLIDRGDPEMFEYLVQQTIKENSFMGAPYPRSLAEVAVKNRARRIRRQAAVLSGAILSALEQVSSARSVAEGRRILFFVSEGFPLDSQEANSTSKLQHLADVAARTGTVIYSVDAHGLTVPMIDASSSISPDLATSEGRPFAATGQMAEQIATQEVLRALAADTGGRALLNTNALEKAVAKSLDETSQYYLLGWRPENVESESGGPKFRKIEVSVKGRPDLTVRVRRGFFENAQGRAAVPKAAPATASPATTSANAALNDALKSLNVRRDLPVDLYAVFTSDAQTGPALNAAVQLESGQVQLDASGGARRPDIDVSYVVLDGKGKVVGSAGRSLTIDAGSTAGKKRLQIVTTFTVPVGGPGLYQFRVAARESLTGLLGSASQWVEVPDLKASRLALSSLLLSEESTAQASSAPTIIPKVARRFQRSAQLLLRLVVYNAARGTAGSAPDVSMEIKVRRNNQSVMGAPPHKVSIVEGSDAASIPYAAKIPLQSLTPGVYSLEVIATDKVSKATATRQMDFTIE